MQIVYVIPQLRTTNLAAAIEFYTAKLGFTLEFQYRRLLRVHAIGASARPPQADRRSGSGQLRSSIARSTSTCISRPPTSLPWPRS